MKKNLLLFIFILLFLNPLFSLPDDEITKLIKTMSLREKVGQLFVVMPDVFDPDLSVIEINNMGIQGVTHITPEIRQYYDNYPAGGFIIFGKNIDNKIQLIQLNSQLHQLGKIPPLIYVDEEGGSVARVANSDKIDVPKVQQMYYIGQTKNYDKAFQTGLTIGYYLKELGFDVNFAPVADVLDKNIESPIGYRSFGNNSKIVANMAVSTMNGLSQNDILSCFKHFPGHGSSNQDTHFEFASVSKTWKELYNSDLIPFKYGIKNDVPYIMISHISYPKIDKNNTPATLSYTLITEKLRKELKYDGIIITDAMSMGAILNKYDDEQSSVLAIKAGVDIILMPFCYENAFESILRAVNNGRISEQRIDESVYRILKLKNKHFNLIK